ncbi:MAG: NADH-quinone oxidoreductase subunit M [Phycisphaerales bacterium]|nr:NADH-quinone oxidoreductase subunit M [Phycisphaerales bacterium]
MWAALLILIPLAGAAAVAVAPARQAKWFALLGTVATLGYSVVLAAAFGHWGDGGFGFQAQFTWLRTLGITFSLGADSVSMLLVLLTTVLMPLCVIGSFTAIHERLKEYYGWILALEAAMLGVFIARDIVLFYIAFEFTLVPMFFMIAIWGGSNRDKACVKFFIYTFTGSLLALAGILYVVWQSAVATGAWSFDIAGLTTFASQSLSASEQGWVLAALLAGFAVKVPLFPVHTWLPLAHTEAPTAGSVILAGVLLKLGTYGLFRFVLPMVPLGLIDPVTWKVLWLFDVEFVPVRFIAVLSVIGILYAALICWVQTDVKKLVAYSSVSHLGFCVLGLFALNPMGVQGSVLYMLNHGLSTGALFFLIGMIYERYHTRDMRRMGGLAKRMPVWSFFMVFFVLASVGLPGLNGFVSEFLCLIAAFIATPDAPTYPGLLGPWYAAAAGLGMIFAAMYLLIMVGRVVFGPLKEPALEDEHLHHGPSLPADLTLREIGVLVPLAALCLYFGFQPGVLTDVIETAAERVLAGYPEIVDAYRPEIMAADVPPAPAGLEFTLEGARTDG